jgi:hypothetical protein
MGVVIICQACRFWLVVDPLFIVGWLREDGRGLVDCRFAGVGEQLAGGLRLSPAQGARGWAGGWPSRNGIQIAIAEDVELRRIALR